MSIYYRQNVRKKAQKCMETMKNRKHKNVWKLWKIESTKMNGNYGK